MHATPAAPAPDMTTFSECMSRSRTLVAPSSAASTTIAVPCWSSCMTGQSSASIRRRSISKHRGAEMSSRLTAPNVGRSRMTVSTISSGSFVSSTIGIESKPPNVLNSADLPSITGSDAAGPMSPRPSTAVPSLITATRRLAQVYWLGQGVVGRDRAADLGYARGVGDRQRALGVQRRLQLDGQLAADVSGEDLLVIDDEAGGTHHFGHGVRVLAPDLTEQGSPAVKCARKATGA